MAEISHSKYPQNFIDKLPHIHASFKKRFITTFFDMFFSVLINVPIFLVLCKFTGGVTDTYNLPNIYNLSPKPITMLYFSVYMLVWCLFLFCIFPLIYTPQTIFSSLFGVKAVTLSGEKVGFVNYFKAYFVPIFLVLFANIAFFSMACSSSTSIQYVSFNSTGGFDKYWILPVKFIFLAVVLIQIHYLITVALSKNKRNWFAQAFDIVYIDTKKAKMFLSDIQDPNEIHDKTLFQGDGIDYSADSEDSDEEYDEDSEENLEDSDETEDDDMEDEEMDDSDDENDDESEDDDMEDEDTEESDEDSDETEDSDEETEDEDSEDDESEISDEEMDDSDEDSEESDEESEETNA